MYRVFILIFISSFAICNMGCKKATERNIESRFTFLVGDVALNGNKAKLGDTVAYNDTIITGTDGICRIQIGEKTVLQLNKGTKLVYKISGEESTLQIDKGWVAGVTRKLFTKSGKYLIKTPTMTASIRGTSYCIKIENPESSYFCVCNGTIRLAGNESKDGEDVTAAHHAAKRFKLDNAGKIISEDAEMLYHGDEVIEKIAKSIDETIDWKVPDQK